LAFLPNPGKCGCFKMSSDTILFYSGVNAFWDLSMTR
jgi:hypothetical protein